MSWQHWLDTAGEDDDDPDALYELEVEKALELRHLDREWWGWD